MHTRHPESQEDAIEWHPIFEFRMVKQKRKAIQKRCFMVKMHHVWLVVSQEIFLYVDIHLYFYVEILLAYICSIVCLPFLFTVFTVSALTLSRRKPLSYRNQSINQWTGFYMITASVLKGLRTGTSNLSQHK